MNKDSKKYKEKFTGEIRRIFSLIEDGLKENKCLYKDGIMKLDDDTLSKLTENPDDFHTDVIVFLMIIIQAYPEDTVELENETEHLLASMLMRLMSFAFLEKNGFISLKYGINKLDLDHKIYVQPMFEISITTNGV